MAPTIKPGDTLPDFVFNTPFQSGRRLSEALAKGKPTALVFLRYYGCPICQLDLRDLKAAWPQLSQQGGLLVVLQSDPVALAAQLEPGSFPFELVCDPQGALYRQFGIEAAAGKLKLAGGKTVAKLARATAAGIRHGAYEGEELQLPAVFLLGPDRTVSWAHYGRGAGDIPTPQELAALLQTHATL